ncbi:MAG: hypothetical protein ACYSTF_08830 [Planctomycetota bacterium]|jgi:hypothetical protein
MAEQQEAQSSEARYPTLRFADFLENSPAYHEVIISDLWYGDSDLQNLCRPELTLLCEHDSCQGMRLFEYRDCTGALYNIDERNELLLEYQCKNCEVTRKSFCFLTFKLYSGGAGLVVKLGEWPPFGPKTPTRLLRLLGPDKDLFLRGRRAECHGLGLGAFTYYRRVVENQKNRLLDEIIKVVQKVEASPVAIVADLTKAKKTFQFAQSVAEVKLAIPQVLLIDGHNPLLLLHNALSAGIHDKSDDECLELAKSIRHVLAGLAERLGQALSQKRELSEAVSKLFRVKTDKGKSKGEQQEN